MNIISRFSNGWSISMDSFKVLKKNRQLIIFPILSGASLIILTASFAFAAVFASDTVLAWIDMESSRYLSYLVVFGFYLVNYFIVVFFNVALMHCLRMYFTGEEVNLRDGLDFSFSRIGVIVSWSLVAATVGTILKVIQQETGLIGKIITGIIGIIWNIATFFVVPVIAYENAGPIDAIKRSSAIMKEKWGESLSGNFSLGLVQFIALVITALPLYLLGAMVNPVIGILLAVFACLFIFAVMSAVQAIFVSAVYHHHILGTETEVINDDSVDNLFVPRR